MDLDRILEPFREQTTITTEDLPLFGLTVLSYFITRMFLGKLVLPKIARATNVDKKQEFKFIHRGFDCLHYCFSSIVGSLALYDRPYLKCCFWAKECAEYLMPNPSGFICTRLEKFYYFIFCAYYACDVLFLFTTPKDLFFMGLHHVITISMITLSVALNAPVVGLVIMLLHDYVDVPVYIGKVLTYMKVKLLKDIALFTFAIFLVYFRLINLPLVIYNLWKNIPEVTVRPKLYLFTWSMLIVLMICHMHWFRKVVQALIKVAKVGEEAIRDPRSDEGEDGEENNKKNN